MTQFTSLFDPFAIHFSSFAGDVYTLDTASITLTAGTMTANALTTTGLTTTGELLITAPSGNSYKFQQGGANANFMGITGTALNTETRISLHAGTGDGGDNVLFEIFGFGDVDAVAASGDIHRLQIGWDQSQYIITTNKTNSGVAKDLVISTHGNTDQLKLDTDGSILMATGNLTVSGGNRITAGAMSIIGTGTDAVLTMDGSSTDAGMFTYESDNALFILNRAVQMDSGLTVNITTLVVDSVASTLNGTNLAGDNTNFNIFLGTDSFSNDGGEFNIGFGFESGKNNDTTGATFEGDRNIYMGYQSGAGLTGGSNNTGTANVGIGYRTLRLNTTGNENFALGFEALSRNTSGSRNTAIGSLSMNLATTHSDNVALGSNTMSKTTTGASNNTVIGSTAGQWISSGDNNINIGYRCARFNQTGSKNTVIGTQAGGTGGGAVSSYDQGTYIGYFSGNNITTGDRNIFLGINSGASQTTNSDLLIIDRALAAGVRASTADELANAILYGVMADTAANQSLRVNAELILAESGTAGDYASFVTDGDGALTITTVDSDGAATADKVNAIW
ncbi:hypothetical protein LCGC14_1370520, partial [marine sediment metagenome]